MSQHQEPEPDQLVGIMQAIQLEHATGLLIVRRGIGVTLEEGTIVFVDGQVAEAKAGWRTGIKALNWLSTWGKCLFRFVPANSQESPLPSPSHGQTETLIDTNPSLSTPNSPLGQQDTSYGEEKETEGVELPNFSAPPLLVPYRTLQLNAALQEIEHRGLSRNHRLLLFWLDGRRSTTELMALVRCSEGELYKMLRDLEHAAVIRVPDGLS